MAQVSLYEQVQNNRYYTVVPPTFKSAGTDYKQAHRQAIVQDLDLATAPELLFLQARSKYMCLNTPVATGALKKYKKDLGAIKVQWVDKKKKVHKKMQKLWEEFEENPCLDNKGDFETFQVTLNSDRFITGEGIARMVIRKKGNSNRIPLKLQGIESEYLDPIYNGLDKNHPLGLTRYGITFDSETYNIPQYYNFFRERYFGIDAKGFKNPSIRVQVDASNVIHCFERIRSNQWRGLPLLASAMIPLYALEDLCTATVATQTSSAAITWIIEQSASFGRTPIGTAQTRGNSSFDDAKEKIVFDATGGGVQYTNPGDIFKLVQSRDVGSNLLGLIKEQYQEIAASLDWNYFELTGDLSSMNFSSIRAALIQTRKRLEFEYDIILIPDVLVPICRRFKELALINHAVDDAYPTFIYPRWYGVDDLKDAQADLLEMVSGFTPLQEILKKRGYTEDQIKESFNLLTSLGLGHLITSTDRKFVESVSDGNPKSLKSNQNSSSN